MLLSKATEDCITRLTHSPYTTTPFHSSQPSSNHPSPFNLASSLPLTQHPRLTQWFPPAGCPRPDGMPHVDLVNQTEANRGSFPPGTLLTYTCEAGYSPDGPTTITCTGTGTWSHPPPRCLRSNGEPPARRVSHDALLAH